MPFLGRTWILREPPWFEKTCWCKEGLNRCLINLKKNYVCYKGVSFFWTVLSDEQMSNDHFPQHNSRNPVFFFLQAPPGWFFLTKASGWLPNFATKNATIATAGAFVGIRDPSKSSQIRSEIPSRSLGRRLGSCEAITCCIIERFKR